MTTTKEIKDWAKDILEQTNKLWEKYHFWEPGFAVFYSPLHEKPDLMVIGYNPGGDASSFDKKEAISMPSEHDYFLNKYRLAEEMRKMFKEINREETLKRSVKLNLVFFRSRNALEFASMDKTMRKEIETFCYGKIKDIINRLQPKVIITEGIKTYDKLLSLLEQPTSERSCWDKSTTKYAINGRRCYCSSNCHNIKIIGLLHLSGARPSELEKKIIKTSLDSDLKSFGLVEKSVYS